MVNRGCKRENVEDVVGIEFRVWFGSYYYDFCILRCCFFVGDIGDFCVFGRRRKRGFVRI